MAQSVECLSLAQVMILESQYLAPRRGPCSMGSLLLLLPLHLPPLVLFLSQINKYINEIFKKEN